MSVKHIRGVYDGLVLKIIQPGTKKYLVTCFGVLELDQGTLLSCGSCSKFDSRFGKGSPSSVDVSQFRITFVLEESVSDARTSSTSTVDREFFLLVYAEIFARCEMLVDEWSQQLKLKSLNVRKGEFNFTALSMVERQRFQLPMRPDLSHQGVASQKDMFHSPLGLL